MYINYFQYFYNDETSKQLNFHQINSVLYWCGIILLYSTFFWKIVPKFKTGTHLNFRTLTTLELGFDLVIRYGHLKNIINVVLFENSNGIALNFSHYGFMTNATAAQAECAKPCWKSWMFYLSDFCNNVSTEPVERETKKYKKLKTTGCPRLNVEVQNKFLQKF